MKILTLAAVGALMTAGAAFAQTDMPSSSDAMAGASMSAPDYVAAAGASDLFEMQEGQIAEQKGQSAKVRAFGKQMVTDHGKSTQMVQMAAQKSGMTPSPAMLTPDQQQMMQTLQTTSSADFDRTYVQQQAQSHQQALTVQQSYAKGGTDKNLRMAAAKIVPVVQHHIHELSTMGSASTM